MYDVYDTENEGSEVSWPFNNNPSDSRADAPPNANHYVSSGRRIYMLYVYVYNIVRT